MSDASLNVRLQNLRDFTVQIRRVADDAIGGTGIVVSMDGKIVTCAHVVRKLGIEPRDANGAEVGVYFPQARGGETKARRACVAACFPQHDDDAVLLQLTGGASPLAPEQIARLGFADCSDDHPFRSYGYRRLADYGAGIADGTIQGCIEPPVGRVVQSDPVQLQSSQINQGMSGAAVLDTDRNLVVGIVSETWFPDSSTKDRDTAWAVNACVLTVDPLNLPLQDEAYPLRAAPQPKTDVAEARRSVAPVERIALNNAPPPLIEWVGREELLQAVTGDWADPAHRVTGLIGFGGEGKSSLARRWLDDLLADKSQIQPDGVFWWGFYEKPSADEFFEAALKYMSGGAIDPRKVPSASMRANIIGAMLGAGRYLFILDGLEVMQYQEGDQYGLLKSADLRDFLGYLSAPGHASFCLVTSRAPLLDLMEYTTYVHRDVDRLSAADGRALLRKISIRGADPALDEVVADWDGHALTLSLLGAYLVERHAGDVALIRDIPIPAASEPRYERVHRVLHRYDEHLNDAERAFLTLFSAFRTPVEEKAFQSVFRVAPKEKPGALNRILGRKEQALNAPVAALDDAGFKAMVERMVKYRILKYDKDSHAYTTHPLIRAHYFARLTAGDTAQVHAAHERIKEYYLANAGDTPPYPTLDDLKPLIEVVHHACRAGAYDEAFKVYWERIYIRDRRVIVDQLGAYETNLALMLEFFPNGDPSQGPQLGEPGAKRWILNEVGLCMMSLGRLREAVPIHERAMNSILATEEWYNANIGYLNLADLNANLGALEASADAAREALALARREENKRNERYSLTLQAWAAHLRGELRPAGEDFQRAEALESEFDPYVRYLFSRRGIRHADHLQRTGDADYARRITEANLEVCERNHWPIDLSPSHRVLGDLDADAKEHDRAREHYDTALKIARSISDRAVLIEALLARGRWYARYMKDGKAARSDLDEALAYAGEGGYGIYEADIRIALAWAHLAAGDQAAARAEAERAQRMSEEMGYFWGKKDAEEVSGQWTVVGG